MTASDLLLAFLTGAAIAALHAQPGARRELAALRFLAAAPGWQIIWLPPPHGSRLLEIQLQAARWN
jgi:hypothetical protein